ncbi:MAG: glycosyltransferase [Candidatus Abawacabacteria bacterium]|nr:glycosyltransferase [Candidatus Abawacabacteria bacterium]
MRTEPSSDAWIVTLTTFPPRACGIATFSNDLFQAFDQLFAPELQTKVIAMTSESTPELSYSDKVIYQLAQNQQADYAAIAQKLNALSQVKLVSIHHEFGLFGGKYGDYLLRFTQILQKPLVITFHTILPEPDEHLLYVVQTLANQAQSIIVMTSVSRNILETVYGIDREKIVVIPHGIHPVSFAASSKAKKILQIPLDRVLLSTFGLLSKSKGIEYVLDALPAVIAQFPNTHYLILGVTHPVVLQEEGESYRNFLIDKITELGLEKHVSFHNHFLATDELLQFLNATDIYLATPLNPNQAVSGTLSYALGTGRPVIATAFAQAKEAITSDIGILVDFKQSQQITAALLTLLQDPLKQIALGKTAYFKTRSMTWPNIATAYMKTFQKLSIYLNKYKQHAPEIKLDHLMKLTDDFGIIQFAQLAEPDISSGYTVDDNARALIVTVRHYQQNKSAVTLEAALTFLNFLLFVRKSDNKFENYVNQNRELSSQQNNQENLDDANGRTLYALAVAGTSSNMSPLVQKKAQRMYEQSFLVADAFTSPRAKAFLIKSLVLQIQFHPHPILIEQLQVNCDYLLQLYQTYHTADWQWFEPILTYSNALLSEALLCGYTVTQNAEYWEIGKITLDFLIAHTFKNNMYMPIGQHGWFQRGGKRQIFDQQPEDTASMIEALKTMYTISQIELYQELCNRAFHWFLGENLLGQLIYDQVTGGCYDGLGKHGVNLNEGAESTLSYLSSRLLIC